MSSLEQAVTRLEAAHAPVRRVVERHELGSRPREESERWDRRWPGYARARAEAFRDQILRAWGEPPEGVRLEIEDAGAGEPCIVLTVNVIDASPAFFAADSYLARVIEDEEQLIARYDTEALRQLSDWRHRYLTA